MTDVLRDVPTWAKATALLGVPSVISLFFVWWITGTLAAGQTRIETKIDHHEAARMQDMNAMNAFLYAICLNTADENAQADTARARCAVALAAPRDNK